MSLRTIGIAVCAAWLMVGCGDDNPAPDAAVVDSGDGMDAGPFDAGPPPGRCGDGTMNAGETCDDGNRMDGDGCSAMCQRECGDGMLQAGELCDPGIAAGETGACPTDCDDSDVCTTDARIGMACAVECTHAPITAAVDGDMCCPPGETALTDDDCASTCGNSLLEPGETCEAGTMAACPTACDDMNSCTTDTLSGGAATCDAQCTYGEIAVCSLTPDGCCPDTCSSTSDADCSGTCGNGTLEPPELCDDMSSTPCPAPGSCDDGDACTLDELVGSAATCNAECSATPITACSLTSDGCCPGVCNAATDADCTPVCGNGVLEMGEECDDGNTADGDGCSGLCVIEAAGDTAFRLTDVDIMEPHIWLRALFCTDVTNTGLFGQPSLNQQLQNGVQMDTDGDGQLEISIVNVFRPLDPSAATSPMTVAFPACSAPMATTRCALSPAGAATDAVATNMTTGTCLDVLPGTVRPYTPAIMPVVASPGAPCFVSDEQGLTINLPGASVPLQRAQVAATYTGSPVSSLTNGLIRGFLSETDADTTTIMIPGLGSMPVSALLAGGTGSCAPGDDRDTITDSTGATITGWWFYLYFSRAVPVPYTEL